MSMTWEKKKYLKNREREKKRRKKIGKKEIKERRVGKKSEVKGWGFQCALKMHEYNIILSLNQER